MKLIIIAGARPNFMKIAPLIHAAQSYNNRAMGDGAKIQWRLVHTGQHYDVQMSEIFFRELGIPEPDVSLDVGSGSHAIQTARVMERFEPVCTDYKPDWVVVVGDVNSTVACTLVATKLGIRVAHVEAGLRSFDRTMPEEINRLVTDAIADLLLTPSSDADDNLRREGVPNEKICCVGNIMIDCLVANLDRVHANTLVADMGLRPGAFAYVTLHRPSNVDNRATLTSIFDSLRRIARTIPIVFPIHPRTRKMLRSFDLSPKNGDLRFLDPLGYHDSLSLTKDARMVLTDSGGLQEESTYFRTPCLTLRPNTERPITLLVGSNMLTTPATLFGDATDILNGPLRRGACPPLWEGKAAHRVLAELIART